MPLWNIVHSVADYTYKYLHQCDTLTLHTHIGGYLRSLVNWLIDDSVVNGQIGLKQDVGLGASKMTTSLRVHVHNSS